MVKPVARFLKFLLATMVVALLAVAFWLHQGPRSLGWAKPWIVSALNPSDGRFTIAIGEVMIDWHDLSDFGKLRVSKITIAKRDGAMFAQLPEMHVRLDPFGFWPGRRLLHRVTLHAPKLYMMRNARGTVQLGLEDEASSIPLASLFATIADDSSGDSVGTLPFREFGIDDAVLNFRDEPTDTRLTSNPVSLRVLGESGTYDAVLSMPLTYENEKGKITASVRTAAGGDTHLLNVALSRVPAKLLCVFGLCPDNVEGSGVVDGMIGLRVADDGTLLGVKVDIATKNAVLNAPAWFEQPLILGSSSIQAESDGATRTITLNKAVLKLEDTTITATGTARHPEEGWFLDLDGQTDTLDVTKVYKYWPLFMAPDSRLWVTSKLKSGRAEKGILTVKLTPADFAAPQISDAAVDARVDAREITFEYLPGFPLVEKMNGDVHFTGDTVKIDGGGGTMLSAIAISKAVLWCPQLSSDHNPMEAEVTVSAPASDVATLLQVPLLVFDDAAKLDPAKITGNVDATLALKFNAFSDKPSKDPNAVNLDAVDYDISATFKQVAQPGLFGSYDAKSIDGTLKASNNLLAFDGAVTVGDTGISDVSLSQPAKKPLSVKVKSRAGQNGKATNDFNLTYQKAKDGDRVLVRGNKLDASYSYGTSEHSLLKDFPALHLDVNLGQLILAAGVPFSQVEGTLDCSAARCESAQFTAYVGPSADAQPVQASITRNAAGVRQFLLTAEDAGYFLKAFNITDRMVGGALELRGAYDDALTPPALNVRFIVQDFTLKNSQILGRILSIGSLTGLTNALTGSGIAFEKMAADMHSRAGVITLDKGRASGAAMGITVSGAVDTNSTKLDLKGVVVPAYALNSIFANIPIIGALAGGEGEGLIAFNYAVRGPYADPDVMVNPLSGLTPGFLRGIFSAFDEPAATEGGEKKPATGTPVPNNGRF